MGSLWLRVCEDRWRTLVTSSLVGCCLLAVGLWVSPANGKDLMPQKEQETTEFGSTQSPSFDDQKAGIPQSLFTWIKVAKGYEVEAGTRRIHD